MDELQQAIEGIKAAFAEMGEQLLENLIPTFREWEKAFGSWLERNATPRERWFMRHAKRRRVRKKYRNRVIRRLLRGR